MKNNIGKDFGVIDNRPTVQLVQYIRNYKLNPYRIQ